MNALTTALPNIRRVDPAATLRRRVDSARRRFRHNPAARVKMWGQLSALIHRFDLPAPLAIIKQGHSENGARPNNLMAMVAEAWLPMIRSAYPFADVVKGFVSERERMVIAAAQDKPNLAEILAQLHAAETLMFEVKARWRANLREPLGLIVMSWLVVIGYADLILWQVAQTPGRPRGYVLEAQQICHWLFYWGSWLVPLTLILLASGVGYLLSHWLSPSRTVADRFWPFSLYKGLNAADFLLALGILQNAGEDMPSSMRSMASIATPYLRWQIKVIEPILRTKSIGEALRRTGRNFPDAQINALLDIFSRDDVRNFPAHLTRLGDDFSAELRERMEVARKHTNFLSLSFAGLLQVLITALMVAISLPN